MLGESGSSALQGSLSDDSPVIPPSQMRVDALRSPDRHKKQASPSKDAQSVQTQPQEEPTTQKYEDFLKEMEKEASFKPGEKVNNFNINLTVLNII